MNKVALVNRNNEVVAYASTELKNGSMVDFSFDRVKENINANREYNLVNAVRVKVSRNKKYFNDEMMAYLPNAKEINYGEFYA